MMNYIRIIIASAAISFTLMHAELSDVKSTRNFDRILDKKEFVVAVFYKNDKEARKNDSTRREIEMLNRTVERVARQDRYKDAGVMFVRINTARHDLESLAQEYGIRALPTVMLFNYGRSVPGALLPGFIRPYDLQEFIDYYFGNAINTAVQQVSERERRRRNRRSNTYVSYGFGFGF